METCIIKRLSDTLFEQKKNERKIRIEDIIESSRKKEHKRIFCLDCGLFVPRNSAQCCK
jgi:hypothetical protein